MQIKITMRCHLTPVRMAIIKKKDITSIGQDMTKREHLCLVGGNVNWYSHYGKQDRDSSKKLKIKLTYDPAIPSSVFI